MEVLVKRQRQGASADTIPIDDEGVNCDDASDSPALPEVVHPWAMHPCTCEVRGRLIPVPGESLPRCDHCLKPVEQPDSEIDPCG